MRIGSGVAAKGARIAMRSTMPRGAKVQRATQSMKLRKFTPSGAQSQRAVMDLRLPPWPCLISQTAPITWRVPSGISTKSPSVSARSSGIR